MKKDVDPLSSYELSSLKPWDHSFWLSRSFIEASCVLCQSMLQGDYTSQYSSSRVIFHLARQGLELFLKAAIDSQEKEPAQTGHNINDLYLKYQTIYPELRFHFDVPKSFLVSSNIDLFKKSTNKLRDTLDQRHRYATDKNGESFATPEVVHPEIIYEELEELRRVLYCLEWAEIRPNIRRLENQSTTYQTTETRLNDSLRRSMAFAFWDDSRDLLNLFNCAWEKNDNFSKTGRIKIILNLVMACECALKAHVVLSNPDTDPKKLLKKIKNAGHNTKKLANLATHMQDRATYDAIIELLGIGGVEVRYSLNATFNFFRSKETFDFYDRTMANPHWVSQVKYNLSKLIDACQGDVTGDVQTDWDVWFKIDKAFEELMQ